MDRWEFRDFVYRYLVSSRLDAERIQREIEEALPFVYTCAKHGEWRQGTAVDAALCPRCEDAIYREQMTK